MNNAYITNTDRLNRFKVGTVMVAAGLTQKKLRMPLLILGLLQLVEGATGICMLTYLSQQMKEACPECKSITE